MRWLTVSTKERPGLAAGDPLVLVAPHRQQLKASRECEATGKIAMCYLDRSRPVAVPEVVPELEARACLERMLMRLWADSPGRGQLP